MADIQLAGLGQGGGAGEGGAVNVLPCGSPLGWLISGRFQLVNLHQTGALIKNPPGQEQLTRSMQPELPGASPPPTQIQ